MKKPSAFSHQLSACVQRTFLVLLSAAVLLAAAAGCGASINVKPLRLDDSSLTQNARRFLADSEDAVAIARAWRDTAAAELERTRLWRRGLATGADALAADAKVRPPVDALSRFADATVDLAEKRLALAESELALARQKFTQITAEIATQNDMAVYDLEKIRARTDVLRKDAEADNRAVEQSRRVVEELNTAWLRAYGAYVKAGGGTQAFWLKID